MNALNIRDVKNVFVSDPERPLKCFIVIIIKYDKY